MGEGFMSIVQRISFGGKVAVFVCVLVLAGAFFSAYPAAAHPSPEGTSPSAEHADDMPRAQDVDRTDEASVRKFMEHLRIHFVIVPGTRGYAIEHNDWRKEEDDFYLITVAIPENRIILHDKYPQAQSASLPALDSITSKAAESGDVECEEGEGGNYFCAVLLSGSRQVGQVVVSGFDHDLEDLEVFPLSSCPKVTPGSGADKNKVAADEITNEDTPENREKLKKYVVGMEEHMIEQLGKVYAAALGRDLDDDSALAVAVRSLTLIRPCWRTWPWKHGSIYIFIIEEHVQGGSQYVIFNGNNPEFEGPDLRVKDEDDNDIGKLISDEVGDPDEDGFIEYKWDDPLNPDDDVDAGDPDENGFRKSPGTSPKISYVKRVDRFASYILGSGFYPPAESGDGDGCAVSGKSSTPSGAAFNLFLVVSFLLAGVWFFNGGKVRARQD